MTKQENKMDREVQIRVNVNWHRACESGNSWFILTACRPTKRAVTNAIREWTKCWNGKGHIQVTSIDTTYANDFPATMIAQKIFRFNNH